MEVGQGPNWAVAPKGKKLLHVMRVKGKVLPVNYALCTDDMWGSGGIAPAFLTSALDVS
jgi:hypothetical protein